MSAYSIQWLPVAGEPIPGGFFLEEDNVCTVPEFYNPEWPDDVPVPSTANGCRKAERFLLCADLQPGDLVVDIYRPMQYGRVREANVNAIDDSEIDWDCNKEKYTKCSRFSKGLALKVLGKVSAEAIWLGEDDEVDTMNLAYVQVSGRKIEHIPLIDRPSSGSFTDIYVIRCPTCKKYN